LSKVKISNNTPVKLSARQSLQLSQLRLDQRELMGPDVDLEAFKLQMRGVMPVDIIQSITDASITRTIAGASTLSVDVLDKHRLLLRSGKLSHKQDVQIEGLWFRMVSNKKSSDTITLVFEDREIAVLRTYAQPIKASASTSRTKITRAQFILRMIRDVVEFKIPVSIPELKIKQPIGAATEGSTDALNQFNAAHRTLGIAKGTPLTVKGSPATPTQVQIAGTILDVGASKLLARPILVMAIMCAIQESTLRNLVGGDADSRGVFQQQKYINGQRTDWPASRDVAKDSAAFFDKLAVLYAANPSAQYWQLITDVQHPAAQYATAYAQWRTEAERFVSAYGMPPGDIASANGSFQNPFSPSSSSNYEFYRGVVPVSGQSGWLPEDSWTCIQRLASEVGWRAFFVSGTFYYISDDDLFSSQPRMRVTEGMNGVDYIDGDYDENKKVGSCTVYCRTGRWGAPPGSVVELYDMGPYNGRWLITEFSRSLFNDQATISLEKPRPVLPEPISDSANSAQTSSLGTTNLFSGPATSVTNPPGTQAQFGGVIPKDTLGSRAAVVQVALLAAAEEKKQHYVWIESRPMPTSLWSTAAHNKPGIDCSTFATLCYKEAGCPDPNHPDGIYDGSGNTSTLVANGLWVNVPQPGDLVMFGTNKSYPSHVAVYIGNSQCIEIGGSAGIVLQSLTYRSDILGYVSFPFPNDQLPS